MEHTVTALFETRRGAEIAVEHLVQEHGVETHGAPELGGPIEISVDCRGGREATVRAALQAAGATSLHTS